MKYYVLFFFVLFLCACTGDENSSSCSVSVQLLSPTDEVTLPFEEMEVVLTNKDQGTVYTSSCASDGVALWNMDIIQLPYIINLFPELFSVEDWNLCRYCPNRVKK